MLVGFVVETGYVHLDGDEGIHARALLIAAAASAFAATLALGRSVARNPPSRLDLSAARLYGRAVAPARFFTAMGRTWALTAVAGVFATAGVVRGGSALPIAILFVSQTLSQGAIAVLKARFARPRPTAWLVRLERGRSYPSGHAATAIIFFVPLALVTLHDVPRTPADLFYVGPPASAAAAAVAAVALGCTLGIPWSRIVLGAHFLSDVAGGLLFGCAWTLALAAILIP